MSSRATANPFFLPTQISGCESWFDAGDANTLLLSGLNVTQWNTKSGNGRNATPFSNVTIGNWNGNRIVQIPPGSDMRFTGTYSQQSRSWFIVARSDTQSMVSLALVHGYNCFEQQIGINSGSPNFVIYNNNPCIPGNLAYANIPNVYNIMQMYSVINNGADPSLNIIGINGTPQTLVATNTATTLLTSNTFTISRADLNSGLSVCEIIGYNGNLSTSNRQQIEGYLAWKWGLQSSLPANHPYKSSIIPPLLSPPATFPLSIQSSFFSPTQISGCSLWLDAADSASLNLSGTSVTRWNDKSGNRNDFVQLSGFSLPSVSTNAINSLPCLSFTGNNIMNNSSNQILTNSSFVLNSSAAGYSIFTVTRQNASAPSYTGYNYILSAYGGGTGAGLFYGTIEITKYFLTANGTAGPIYGFNDLTANTPNTLMTTNQLTSISVIGSTLTPYLNGTAMGTKTGTVISLTGLSIGNAYAPGQTFTGQTWGGVIGEILIFNANITTQQRQQIEGYLAWKWGLQSSLPADHPYKSSPLPPLVNVPTTLPVIVSANWIPTRFSGIQLWLDAADSATITTSGTTITGWTDKSGTSRTVTFSGTSTYNAQAKSVNTTNTPISYFYANVNLKKSVVTYANVFIVYSWTGSSLAGTNQALWGQDIGGGWNRFQLLGFTFNTAWAYGLSYTPNSPNVTTVSPLNTPNRLIYSATYAYQIPNGSYAYVNGSLASSTVTEAVSPSETSTTNTYFATIDTGYSGAVAFNEIIINTNNLTTSQRQQIEGYLAWKWGLQNSLPANHPFRLWPPPP